MKSPVQNFLFRVATEVEKKAKKLAPVDTGNLKRDIQVFNDDIDNLEISIGNSTLAPYAKYIHEGTGKKARDQSKTTGSIKKGGITPNTYLEDAAKEVLTGSNLNKLADSMVDSVGEEIVKDLKDNFDIEVN